jgi:hypothetical protein
MQEKDVKRAEGVYCQWISSSGVKLLEIERVNGDCPVTRMVCTQEEADAIRTALAEKQ